MNKLFFSLLLAILFLGSGCDDEEPGGGNACSSDFDQAAMLRQYAEGEIVPAFTAFAAAADQLESAGTNFLTNPSTNTLAAFRAQFSTTYRSWQGVEPFAFGPAERLALRSTINPFPTDTSRVNDLITNGVPAEYAFTFDQGLPALDYLLFARDVEATVQFFMAAPNANLSDYVATQLQSISQLANQALTDWRGDYGNTFVANTGTAAGTGLSLVINSLNEHWENTKRDRVGIPSGVVTLGFTNPDNVEGRYSGLSASLLEEAVRTSQRYFRAGDGTGLDDYLEAVGAEKNGRSLTSLINEQYAAGLAALDAVNDPLSEAVDTEPDAVSDLYRELVQNIVLLKTDMPSVLCVAITYVDNPSDSD